LNRVRAVVNSTRGSARFVRFPDLWGTAGLLADKLPLERPPVYPRPLRQAGHWTRLVFWDRALTNREASAVLTLGRTRWGVAGGAAIAAAIISPKLPPWPRRLLIAAAATFAVRKQRLRRFISFQRQLHRVAPGGLIVGDLVAREPGSAVAWITEVFTNLDASDDQTTLIAILPGARRDRARERLYTTAFKFRVAARKSGDGKSTILVRAPTASRTRTD
jgi:hypothetical protein